MNKETKILVVDDSELMRINILHQINEDFDESNIFFAGTIAEAWEILKKNTINILLLDIYLPGQNGADLMSDMFAEKELKDIPIIVITGTSGDSFVKASFEKYVYAYLHKPINRDKLLKAIKECLVLK